jgi:hypothetical protein
MFLIPKTLYSVRKTAHKGRGVFAIKDIPAGTIIGDYLGTLMHPDDEDEEQSGLYTFSLTDTMDVFPDVKSEGIHLINHSCMPNCDVYSLDDHVLYVATRHIFKGEELSIDYSLDPIDTEEGECKHACRCGTFLCRGTMHTSEDVQDSWMKMAPAEHTTRGRKRLGRAGSKLAPLDSYPKTIRDHSIWDIYPNTKKPPLVRNDRSLPKVSEIRRLMRESGRALAFPALKVRIDGVLNRRLLIERV